jgi:hypothetical protein
MENFLVMGELLQELENDVAKAKANFDETGTDYDMGLWVGATLAYANAVQAYKKMLKD